MRGSCTHQAVLTNSVRQASINVSSAYTRLITKMLFYTREEDRAQRLQGTENYAFIHHNSFHNVLN